MAVPPSLSGFTSNSDTIWGRGLGWHITGRRGKRSYVGRVYEITTLLYTWEELYIYYTVQIVLVCLISGIWNIVSMEHLQQVWHASRERLPFRTPGSVPLFGTCLCSNCWYQIPRTCHVFIRLFTLNAPSYFLEFD